MIPGEECHGVQKKTLAVAARGTGQV